VAEIRGVSDQSHPAYNIADQVAAKEQIQLLHEAGFSELIDILENDPTGEKESVFSAGGTLIIGKLAARLGRPQKQVKELLAEAKSLIDPQQAGHSCSDLTSTAPASTTGSSAGTEETATGEKLSPGSSRSPASCPTNSKARQKRSKMRRAMQRCGR